MQKVPQDSTEVRSTCVQSAMDVPLLSGFRIEMVSGAEPPHGFQRYMTLLQSMDDFMGQLIGSPPVEDA